MFRFCSRKCVKLYFGSVGAPSDFTPSSVSETPSSTSGISASSTATVIDLRDINEEGKAEATSDVNKVDNVETTNHIPDEISHAPQANDFIWQIVYKLDKIVS
ncbi:hypothetical protein V7S43_010513 [Phytophthora oleae]|uniref:Uncharacterized protein n=1 Tax=Phytophthora oleae TaxID=2107226 RepID=A0ABD3FD16_9STRA